LKLILARYFLIISLVLAAQTICAQQSIEVKPEKNTMLLGEPLAVTIKITGLQAYTAALPDTLGSFEILDAKPPTTIPANGSITSTQEIIVTSFDSGQQRLPPIGIQGNPSFVSAGVDVMVNPVPADSTKAYGDIKQIADLEQPAQWPYALALLAILLLSAYAILKLNKKRAVIQPSFEIPEPLVSPNTLLQQLEQLKEQWIQQQTGPVILGNQLMEIFRKYLASRGINARSKTGEEMIVLTKDKYEADIWQGIAQTVRLCNAMRFGKYQAAQQQGLEGIDGFRRAIKPTPLS
jgi:hypothetical protein